METIAQLKETEIQEIMLPTIQAFTPLLEPLREEVGNARKTFKYGSTDRHQLDVYYPPSTGKKHPILVYVYGGGFISGERRLAAPVDVAYGNLGLYFAKRGFVTIIPDYRLAPGTTFPGPAQDIHDAVAWAVAHPAELGPDADIHSVFLLGHSAGGVHTLTLLLAPALSASAQRLPIKGAFISSAPSHFPPAPAAGPWALYYGSPDATALHEPLALLNAAAPEVIAGLPPLAILGCENDPVWFKKVAGEFEGAWAEKGVKPKQILAKGHNHISPSLALGTGQGEEWAEEFVAWAEGL
ncbi:alpha/beta-hydrolase [Mycena galericulata]|nr:alpha/beta-hydrolase [Mycena galericulata]